MLELLLAGILIVLLLILFSLWLLSKSLRWEFLYQNGGVLACLPEINDSLESLVGSRNIGRETHGKIDDLFSRLEAIEGLLNEIEVTTAPFRHAEFPGMPRKKWPDSVS